MADKSRERNYVDMFSDYGLDERQIAIQNKIMKKCFKYSFTGSLVLTCVWIMLGAAELAIPFTYTAVSYYILLIVCGIIHAVQASKNGVINGIAAAQISGKGQIAVIIFSTICIFGRAFKEFETFNHYWVSLVFMVVTTLIYAVVLHFCGKRNFKVLDEESTDDTDESGEE